MDKKQLTEGLNQLKQLSEDDYHQPLETILSDSNDQVVFRRLGRLIGVTLKQPFATLTVLRHPSQHSHSYRGWELAADSFERPEAQQTWQYHTLEAILREAPDGRRFRSIEELARDARDERGFFGYLARSARKYICGDAGIRKEIDKNVKAAKKAGFPTTHLTPEVLVQAGGLSLGAYLIGRVPIFGLVGAPVVAGFVLVLYSIGLNAFCKYIDDYNGDHEQ
jgi:hypothetical protein